MAHAAAPVVPPSQPISFDMLKATWDSLPVGARYQIDLVLQPGLASDAMNPGFSSVTASGPAGDSYFEGLRLPVGSDLVAMLAPVKDPVRATVNAHKEAGASFGAILVVDSLKLVAVLDEAGHPFEGLVAIGMSVPVRVSTRLDGTPNAPPLVLSPGPTGLWMQLPSGELSVGVSVPKGGTRDVEIYIGGKWVGVKLTAPGGW